MRIQFQHCVLDTHELVYTPHEDTFFLEDCLRRFLADKTIHTICDVGTGSGYIAITLGLCYPQASVLALDINPHAVELAKQNLRLNGVTGEVRKSDLFTNVSAEEMFDLVVFNPPYLPSSTLPDAQSDMRELAWAGGVEGAEITSRFLSLVIDHLTIGGQCFLLLAGFGKTSLILGNTSLVVTQVAKKKLGFETLEAVVLERPRKEDL